MSRPLFLLLLLFDTCHRGRSLLTQHGYLLPCAVPKKGGCLRPHTGLQPIMVAGENREEQKRPHTLEDVGRAGRELDGLRPGTKVVNAGRRTKEFTTDPLGRSVVNVPVFRASTVTFPNTTALRARPEGAATVWEGLYYGRYGSLTHRSLEDAFATLEGGYRGCTCSTIQAAVTSVLFGLLRAGDHVLLSSNVSPHVKRVCSVMLGNLGVKSTSFPAYSSDADLDSLFQGEGQRPKVVLVQGIAPPELELVDLASIVQVAHKHRAVVVYDNTWTSGWAFPAMNLGADVVVCNAAGALSPDGALDGPGLITSTEGVWKRVRFGCKQLGMVMSPDDGYKTLRATRTLPLRMHAQDAATRRLAAFLQEQEAVQEVCHLSLPSHPRHALWRDTCAGAPPFLHFRLRAEASEESVILFLSALRLIELGGGDAGWTGESSKIWPAAAVREWDSRARRVGAGAKDASFGGPAGGRQGALQGQMILYVGLESVEDLLGRCRVCGVCGDCGYVSARLLALGCAPMTMLAPAQQPQNLNSKPYTSTLNPQPNVSRLCAQAILPRRSGS